MSELHFDAAFMALTKTDQTSYPPFPWQEELFARFMKGTIDRSLDIPTGLGKTNVMAIWLIARAAGAPLPRRLAYVVDRRAVVDQATDIAIRLRENLDHNLDLKKSLGLGANSSLPISTLRGQHVDNKKWLEDPASPAIIVGTVDMIGSRLLFEGYGTSRKMRPYHAGLLGADTLVVLDEAHLVPPFEKLIETIAEGAAVFGQPDDALRSLIPQFKLLSLSATGRVHAGVAFGLQGADLTNNQVVRRRLDAPKRLTITTLEDQKKLPDALAEEAWKLTDNGKTAVRIIVFCDKRKDAEAAKEAIDNRANGDKKQGILRVPVHTELFVGGRRVFEREEASDRLKALGFIAGSTTERSRPAFVFATSAGEVGVDLDADHMVSDLVAWERMVQRLGRVNRRGDGEAHIVVVAEPEPKPKKGVQDSLAKHPKDRTEKEISAIAAYEASIEWERAIRKAQECLPTKNGATDASPGAIRDLKLKAKNDADLLAILDAATTPAPIRPALSRALVDAWSMTSLKEHTGRPEIDPWLRGWIENDPPQTSVVWRTYLPTRTGENATRKDVTKKEIEAFFEAAPPHTSEVLETETYRVAKWLTARAKALDKASESPPAGRTDDNEPSEKIPLRGSDVTAIALTNAGDWRKSLTLDDLKRLEDDYNEEAKKAKQTKKAFKHFLNGAMLVVDARLGGLEVGLLKEAAGDPPPTADGDNPWLRTTENEPVVRFRVRIGDADSKLPTNDERRWRQRFRFPITLSDDGEPSRWLIVEKWLYDAATEDDRSAGHPQLLDTHQQWAERRALELAKRLNLPDDYTEMLRIAARLHDEGKKAKRWQLAFNAKSDGVYAKTRGPVNVALLDGYRHEFGSLPVVANDSDFIKLHIDLQNLALHLIAAHHGFARPVTSASGCEDAPPSALEERTQEVALRYARLQKRWGPWGLAWWESLLRAVDQQASRDNDTEDSAAAKEGV
jgi:CRISPR-associated endonuclease/helicase Cas3